MLIDPMCQCPECFGFQELLAVEQAKNGENKTTRPILARHVGTGANYTQTEAVCALHSPASTHAKNTIQSQCWCMCEGKLRANASCRKSCADSVHKSSQQRRSMQSTKVLTKAGRNYSREEQRRRLSGQKMIGGSCPIERVIRPKAKLTLI